MGKNAYAGGGDASPIRAGSKEPTTINRRGGSPEEIS